MKDLVHQPVLLHEVVQLLVTREAGVYLDCTVGLGGHSEAILKKLSPSGRVIGIDWDAQALEKAQQRLGAFKNVAFYHLNFSQIDQLKRLAGTEQFTGILFDLGLGSWQINQTERGFSYLSAGPLDMRMDQSQRLTALEVVNQYSQEELAKIFKEYGEEKLGKRIAREIKKVRQKFETTKQLAELIERRVSPPNRIKTLSRIFQAIRMEVNQELEELKAGLALAVLATEPKGRIGIISYQSLEDRLVKRTFQELAKNCICPSDSPVCTCGKKAEWRILTKKPIRPSPAEISSNPSARSAKLRVAEKLETIA